jgi:hypothetical protein
LVVRRAVETGKKHVEWRARTMKKGRISQINTPGFPRRCLAQSNKPGLVVTGREAWRENSAVPAKLERDRKISPQVYL